VDASILVSAADAAEVAAADAAEASAPEDLK
jgi:hypothetical protein